MLTNLDTVKNALAAWWAGIPDLRAALETANEVAQALAADPQATELKQTLDQLKQLIERLAADLQRANQLTQAFNPADPATLDARQAAVVAAQNLRDSIERFAQVYDRVSALLLSNDISKTPAQSDAISLAIAKAAPTLDALPEVARQALAYATSLVSPQPGAAAPAKEDVEQVEEVVGSAQNLAQAVSHAAFAIIEPPQLTPDILYAICESIMPAANMAYILNYYKYSWVEHLRTRVPST